MEQAIDKWSGLANMFADLIEKYADELDIESLPEPEITYQKALGLIEEDIRKFSKKAS